MTEIKQKTSQHEVCVPEWRHVTAVDVEKKLIELMTPQNIWVEYPSQGEKYIHIPKDWDHGDPNENFDVMVHFDNGVLTTETISGTMLETRDVLTWMKEKGCQLCCGNEEVSPEEAEQILSLDLARYDKTPILEIRRTKENGIPLSIQIFGTLHTPEVKEITRIGNLDDEQHTQADKGTYVKNVKKMARMFATNGTTKKKREIGIDINAVQEGTTDDLFASLATTLASIEWRKSEGIWPKNAYVVLRGLNITWQAAITLMVWCEKNETPAIVEVGSVATCLGGTEKDLNYVKFPNGRFVFGDVGKETVVDDIDQVNPGIVEVNGGSEKHHDLIPLRGGEAMRRIVEEIANNPESGKNGRKRNYITLRASRAGKGLEKYAVMLRVGDVGKKLSISDVAHSPWLS